MKVAHVTDCYLPRLGGIEIQVYDLAERQRAAGHEVEVISSVTPNGAGRIRYHRTRRARDAALSGGYDVIHVHASNFSPLAFLAAVSAAQAGIPVVFTLHSLWSYAEPIFRTSDRLLHWGGLPVVWSAVSRAAAAPLQRLLGARAVVELLPNCTDATAWQLVPAPRDPSEIRLMAVMRLARRKRPLQMVDMFAAARDRTRDDVRLALEIVGDGPMRRKVERRISRLDLSGSVRLAGQLTRAEIGHRYTRADAFVSPATLESFGIAALEARCAGVPVLARRDTGVSDFIQDGLEGLLVDGDSGMVDGIVTLARDGELRRRLAAYNRRVPPTLTWKVILAATDRLYRIAGAPLAARPVAVVGSPA